MMTLIKKKPYIVNPFIDSLIDLFDHLRHQNKKYADIPCVLITGESGSGKSELAKQYLAKNPVNEEKERTHIPVLYLELKSIGSPYDLMRGLLVSIGDPQQGEGKNAKILFDRFFILARVCGLELIIIDELQVIIERRSQRVMTGIADWFKDIIETLRVPIVFMGMPWSKYLVDSNAQLSERISYRRSMPSYRVSQSEGFKDYRRLLKSLKDYYQFPANCNIHDVEYAYRFFSYSEGNLRRTVNLVRDTYAHATDTNKVASMEIFSKVIRSYGISDERNAFLLSIDKLELRELTIPSDWLFGNRANKNSIIDAEYAVYGISPERKIFSLKGVA